MPSIREFHPIRVQVFSDEEAIPGIRKTLPEDFSSIIDILTQDPFTPWGPKEKEAAKLLRQATLLPPDARELEGAWKTLVSRLQVKEGETITPRDLATFMLADILWYQVTLRFFGGRRESRKTEKIRSLVPRDEEAATSYKALTQAMGDFTERIEKTFNHPPQNQGEAQSQINLFEAFYRMCQGSPQNEWVEYGSPKWRNWLHITIEETLLKVAKSPFSYELLREGVLEKTPLSLVLAIWNAQWEGEVSEEKQEELTAFFFARPDFQKFFWEFLRGSPPALIILQAMPNFFQQEELSLAFFQTVPLTEFNPKQQTVLLQKLIGALGVFRGQFPEHPNNASLSQQLRELVGKTGNEARLSQELAILEDRKPGFLYLDEDLGVRVSTKDPQKKTTGKTPLLLYASRAPWPEEIPSAPEPKPIESSPTEPRRDVFVLEQGEIRQLSPWGEVQVLTKLATLTLLEWFKKETKALGLLEEPLFELIASYNGNVLPNKCDTILPDLLPNTHPLAVLGNLGIIGVEHAENTVRFLIDAKRAKVTAIGPQKLLLAGGFNPQGELVIPNAPPDFLYTSPHLLLQAAALWGKTGVRPSAVSREEMPRVHQALRLWNAIAKHNDLPPLIHLDNPVNVLSEPPIRLPLGKKTIYLFFNPS